ncbi:MAG: formylglycine-generating enzyme family protein [Gaiellales bacterium]
MSRRAPVKNEDMVWIPGGEFAMGSDHHYPEEAPAHRVSVDGFWIDRCAVTNRDFARFVDATGHVTVAERAPDPAEYPGARPEYLVPFSAVFQMPPGPVDLRNAYNWWIHLPGASWRKPKGPRGPAALKRLPTHPVVHVAWDDVAAYAEWAGKQLPTEAEWEFAARGGLDGAEYAWGDDMTPGGIHMANTWQGEFPVENLKQDGFAGTAPVGSFPANGYGLHEMTGNVWEWTTDWYRDHAAAPASPCCAPPRNPAGGERERSYDPQLPDVAIPRRVIKGGSHLCAPNYCRRYRPAARMPQAVDTSTSHIGFRCIVLGSTDG